MQIQMRNDIFNTQDIREAIELGLHMNLDNDLEVVFITQMTCQRY